MMVLPRKDPPPLERSRRHGEISFYDPRFRPTSPERWEPNNWIVKADQSSRRRYSAMWLILIAMSWISLLAFLVYVFV